MRFDQYLAQYAATTRLVAKHHLLAEYLEPHIWTQGEDFTPRHYPGWRPPWLPDFLERDGLAPPSHVLLADGEGELREILAAADVLCPPRSRRG